MYFGGQTRDYKPNQYVRQQHIAHYDHLWAGYENDPEANESLKRQQYADDLKKQIAEKKERERIEKAARDAEQTYLENKNNSTLRTISSNSTIPESNIKKTEHITSKPISEFTRTMPQSSTMNNTSKNFTETLRAQIDDCRKSSYSTLSQPIQPLTISQPIPTFAGTTTFDSTQFEMPNLSLVFRSNKSSSGRQSQIRCVSMNGTTSLRSSLDQSSLQPPIINLDSPLNRSKVATPSMGFATRNMKANKNATFYQDSPPKLPTFEFSETTPITHNIQANTTSKYQGFNVASLSHTLQPTHQQAMTLPSPQLLSESQMIYPDGHRTPL